MVNKHKAQETKRVCLFLPSLRGGGAERMMVALANGFVARGLGVDLILSKAEGPYFNEVSAHVEIVDLNASRVLASLPGLAQYLRRKRPAALLSAMSHANVVATVARMLAQVPTRIVVSERAQFSVSRANSTSLRGRGMGRFMRWVYPRADGIVAISLGVADDLAASIGVSRSTIQVVYNPVVTEDLLARSREETNHSWLAKGQPPVILGIGRLVAQKDFFTLIRAFARLREGREARLLILGEGELRGELQTLIRRLGLGGDVMLPGFVESPFAVMRRAALFVLSSAWEGFGNVLAEAMACGVPVISTDCPSGPAEILENGKWGRLVPVGDIDALAEAMAATLDDTEHPDVAARAAEFSVDRAVDGYLRVMLPNG